MKNLVAVLSLCAVMISCNSNKTENEGAYENKGQAEAEVTEKDNATVVDEPAPALAANAHAKGEKLISMSDCLSCHQIDKKLVGPSYVEVAEKYEMNDKNTTYLAGKIITGGKGVWGEIPMTPHPDLSQEDAKEMASYILSLRK